MVLVLVPEPAVLVFYIFQPLEVLIRTRTGPELWVLFLPTFPIMHLPILTWPSLGCHSDEEEPVAAGPSGRSLLPGCDVTVPHAGADAGGRA